MEIGERIRLARKQKMLSQEALAQQANVSKMAISKYERNEDIPSSGVLIRISEALHVPVDFLLRPSNIQVELKAFRKHAALKTKEQEAILVQIQEWVERYYQVESLIPEENSHSELPRFSVSSYEDVENAAQQLRDIWQLGIDAIENLIELLEDRKIKVGLIEGFEDFDACTFMANGSPVIVTKGGIPGDRQRFNVAHELGHLVLEITGDLPEEKAANRFAGAFLVPGVSAINELGAKRSMIDFKELNLLKQEYGLSMQAWIYRARDLGIIDERTYQDLFRVFAQNGWKKKEPGQPLPSEKPTRLRRLVYRAYAEDLISYSRATELLGEPVDVDWSLGATLNAIVENHPGN